MSIEAYDVVDQRILGVGQVGEALAQLVDLRVDCVVVDRGEGQLDAQFVVPDEPDDGSHFDDGLELDVACFLTRLDLDLRRGDHVDVVRLDGFDVVLGQRVAQRLLPRNLGAEARFEQLARRFARTKARNAHLARELAERGIDSSFELVGGDGDVQPDLVPLEGFDRALHRESECTQGVDCIRPRAHGPTLGRCGSYPRAA